MGVRGNDLVLQKKNKQQQKTNLMDSGDDIASDPEGEMTLQKETLTKNIEPEHSSEVNTQRLIDTIFGDEKDLDIEVAEPEDETSPLLLPSSMSSTMMKATHPSLTCSPLK